MKESGINRVSIGVQSFNDRMLSLLGRAHDARQAEEAIKLVADHFKSFSIDLIYGIPGQDEDGWIATLKRALEFAPPHISAYELTPEKNTALYNELNEGVLEAVFEDVVIQMYEICARSLRETGYEHYEISNYALPGQQSRHNMNYWKRGEYLGIGPAAHSFIEGVRRSNVANVEWYCEMLEGGKPPAEQSQQITGKEAAREEIFLGLRTREGVDIGSIVERYLSSQDEPSQLMKRLGQALAPYTGLGHVEFEGGMLSLTEKGFSLSNAIIVVVFQALGL